MRSVTRDESRDTGMAMVLLLLLAEVARPRDGVVLAALVLLVLTMTIPRLFAPAAVVWLGFAHRLGGLTSTLLLSLVFFLIVTPVGLVRRWAGRDSLQLRRFKVGDESVMADRRHTFTASDLERPV